MRSGQPEAATTIRPFKLWVSLPRPPTILVALSHPSAFQTSFDGLCDVVHLNCPEKSLLRDSTLCEHSNFSRETRQARGCSEHRKWDSAPAAAFECEAPAARIPHRQGSGEARRRCASRGRYGHRDATMILVAYRHGLRASELCALRWDQVDLERGLVHVRRLKNGTPSVHPMGGVEIRALRRLKREQIESRYVFVTERRAPMTAAGFRKMVARTGERGKFPFPVHPHMLRHACGYKLANDGQDTRAVQHYLGHKNIQQRCATRSCRRSGSNRFGRIERRRTIARSTWHHAMWRIRANWLSNRAFKSLDDIIDAACQPRGNVIARPELITSIGMRDWAHVGHKRAPWYKFLLDVLRNHEGRACLGAVRPAPFVGAVRPTDEPGLCFSLRTSGPYGISLGHAKSTAFQTNK